MQQISGGKKWLCHLGKKNRCIFVEKKMVYVFEWKIKWSAAKKVGNPLFAGEVYTWDVNKTFLCYWSNVLDSVYEDPDCPPDKIIQDDEKLDTWLDIRSAKRDSNFSAGNVKNVSSLKHHEHKIQF